MLSASYTDPRLAAVYDTLNPFPDASSAFYLDLAGASPIRVLDMGCGTGRLACALAARGHRATGADPSGAMLDLAACRPGADRVQWVRSSAARLDLTERFDLVIMTGHVAQVFLTDAELAAALEALAGHLAAGGRLAFEMRNPAVREWDAWTPAATAERLVVSGLGPVEVHYRVAEERGALVTFETHFRFADAAPVVTRTTLRFVEQETLAAHLAEAGLSALSWFGDWDRSPLSQRSPEIILVAQASNRFGGLGQRDQARP